MAEDIGIDLGTATFLIYTKQRGLILKEPSVIAMARDSKQVKAVGEEAYRMIGRTPGGIVAVRPIKDGVIADEGLTEKMITMFMRKVQGNAGRLFGFRPQLMVGVPSKVSDVERRAVLRAVDHRLRRVDLTIAARLGIGALAVGVAGHRQRVLPAEIVPIVDRKAQRDHRRITGVFADQLVGRWAGRAALAGEEFDDRTRLGLTRLGLRGCARHNGDADKSDRRRDAATIHGDLP